MKTQSKKPKVNLSRGQNNIADVQAMLEDFRACLKNGFSHENWILAVRIYHALATTLFSPERDILSEVIRATYQKLDLDFIDLQVDKVKSAL